MAVRPTVGAVDSDNPVAGVDITFGVTQGSGTVTEHAVVTTDDSGLASVGGWALGAVPGLQQLSVQAPGGFSVTFAATAVARAPARVIPHPGNVTSSQYRGVTTPSVIVVDEFGQPVQGVAVTFSTPDGSSSLSGTNTVSDANGVARVGGWVTGTCAGTATLVASAAGVGQGLSIVVAVSTDVPWRIVADMHLVLSTNLSVGGFMGNPYAKVFRACTDAPMSGIPVTFTVVTEGFIADVKSLVGQTAGAALPSARCLLFSGLGRCQRS